MRSLLVALSAILAATSFVNAGASVAMTDIQKTIKEGWQKFATDPEATKSMYAPDATILLCMDPEPCSEGSFDEVYDPFIKVTSKFHTKWTFERTMEGSFGIQWIGYLETPGGCGGVASGNAFFELNEDGKITREVCFSKNTHDVFNCVNDYVATIDTEQE